MVTALTKIDTPKWLAFAASGKVVPQDFVVPLRSILADSLYYPCGGFDRSPIELFSGNILSFVYVDYWIEKRQYLESIPRMLLGYREIFHKELSYDDVNQNSSFPFEKPPRLIDQILHNQKRFPFFCCWGVWKKEDYLAAPKFWYCEAFPLWRHGPKLISLIYLAAEASLVYHALYCSFSIAPKILFINNPGSKGGEWENIEWNYSFFKKVVSSNSAGMPQYLYSSPRGYARRACWDGYDIQVTDKLWQLNKSNLNDASDNCSKN
jgi:hypothetical protein